ncbi:MAG TPA: hypothetical protein VFV13_15320 [Acidimicrobiia bacterium]|nr:hypothetical protein [Acidimicrobiia bacterium]
MAVNPDPKPGRWILPLVILGMIAFTYFFVRSLPEASPDTTLAAGGTTPTTAGEEGPTSTTAPGQGGTIPDEAAAYIGELDRINGEFQALNAELVAVNTGFDADPREIEFGDAEARMTAVAASAQSLSDQTAALVPPTGLEANQEALAAAASLAARAAGEAVTGLQSADPGDLRRAAVTAFTGAVTDFDVEVENARTAAGAAPDA